MLLENLEYPTISTFASSYSSRGTASRPLATPLPLYSPRRPYSAPESGGRNRTLEMFDRWINEINISSVLLHPLGREDRNASMTSRWPRNGAESLRCFGRPRRLVPDRTESRKLFSEHCRLRIENVENTISIAGITS